MYDEWGMYISSVCSLIDDSLNRNKRKVETTEESIEKQKLLLERIKEQKTGIQVAEETLAYNKNIRKLTEEYIIKKRNQGINNINAAIETSRQILPGIRPMKFDLADTGAKVVMLNGNDGNGVPIYDMVDDLEGSALRAMISFFCKSAVVLSDPDVMNINILDEPFSTLSVDTSAKIAPFLSVMAKNSLVILTEQKKEIFVDANETVFQLKKDEETEISVMTGENVDRIDESEVPK